jgi:hypothetical protein
MPGPRGIITVKGSFKLSDLCDKEFHKMAQFFGMTATYGQHEDKIGIVTIATTKQLKENPAEPEAKKLRVQSSDPKEVIRPKCIYFPEHFCYCFSSNLCVLNATNMD